MKLIEFIKYRPKLRWAIGEHQSHAAGYVRSLLNDPDHILIWVNIRDAFALGHQPAVLDPEHPTGGENSIGDRVARAKQHWQDGGYMNPSVCSINHFGAFDWGDGRHRMVAAFQLGELYSPVLIERSDLDRFEQTEIRTIDV